ncbi:hypothetical protein Patl1_28978 [Pistacia atlantica]|uniref:Uncharacterized protein n=1 Tax=Pistacia atlantica TaxID=434234 RepID=A0ACC1BE06_9ROSI|nr:hypothetical protein Patl1_28978 [Pistacia atlantica]
MANDQDKIPRVFCVGTADTKLEELQFLSESVRFNLTSFSSSQEVVVVDVSVGQKETQSLQDFKFVKRNEVLSFYSESAVKILIGLDDDRGKAIGFMSKSLQHFLKKAVDDQVLVGVIGLGGSGGTSLISSAFRSLPIGIPKVIVSTVSSGQTQPYIGTSDLILIPSVVDVCGINSVSRVVFSNAGAAFSGMVVGKLGAVKRSQN